MTPESVQGMIDHAFLRNSTNGDGSHSSHGDNRRNVQTARPCFYADFMKFQCLNFKGTKGIVGLTRWIEKMELVFQISGCAIENQDKFATCTLLGSALTWWNGQIRTLGPNAYTMTWEILKKKMTDNGLPDNIYGNVKSSKPNTLDETIELANDLMDQKLHTSVERQTDNKRKADDSSKNNHGHQQHPSKRQNVTKIYNMGSGERKPYGGNLPKCTKCHFHHNGLCTQKCHKCNKVGHLARDCRCSGNTNVADTQRVKRAFPKRNVGNAKKKGKSSRDSDSNVVMGTFLLNNRYASILFDTGADRSFMSTAFSFLIHIIPTPLGNSYDVELADGKSTKNILRQFWNFLKKEKLYAKFSKCKFWIPKVQFLDYVFDSRRIHVDPAKIESIKDWETPKILTKICQFLGLAGYYQSAPILALPEGNEDFVVYCDASHKGLGAVLMQREKANIVADALSRKERIEALRVRALVMTMGLDLPEQILEAQIEALKPKSLKNEDVGAGLSYNNSYHASIKAAPYEVLYGQKCRSPICWAEVGEAQLTGLEMIQETKKKIVLIKQRIQATQDRQKSSADLKRKPMEFEVGDRVMIKVIAKVGKFAYRLEIPQELSRVHHTFHVSNLKKCYADEPLGMPLKGIHVDDKL
uniref:Putative reverse transcriptase domain-containing protein n=1 Tax=Tanacetum cinerariifolium TaxID=118510 RepID=A0A699GS63_TANCI|nr:putative reverse transcriptase domain-containing protein [Tanacetum cinerariifolium]